MDADERDEAANDEDDVAPCCQRTGPCRWDAVCRAHVRRWEAAHGEKYVAFLRRTGGVVPAWLGSADDGGDVLPGQRGSSAAVATNAAGIEDYANDEDDELDVGLLGNGGDDALVDYPHPRHACAVFKFETTNHRTHCPNCWYDANDAPRAFSLSRSSARALREGGFECAQSRASVAAKIAHLALFFFSRRTLTSPSRPRPRAGATAATCRRRAATGRSTATRRLARTSGTPCAAASSPAARRLAPRTTFPAPTPRRRRRPARPRLLP